MNSEDKKRLEKSIKYHKMCIENAKEAKRYHKREVEFLKASIKRGFE